MRIVFELEAGQNFELVKSFFSEMNAKGNLEIKNPKTEESIELKYSGVDYSVFMSGALPKKPLDAAIFIPDKQTHVRINKDEIYYVEADGSYIKVFTKKRSFHVSSNLKTFTFQLKDRNFIRVSRKHLINAAHLHKIDGNLLFVGPYEIQLSKSQRKSILDQFPIMQTKISDNV